jgi:serine/threonine protein kinase
MAKELITSPVQPKHLGRYSLFDVVASGGMATVHFGRLGGPVGFARTVAIKCLHPQFARSPDFVTMFLDEARLAARIRHPNVVATLDVVAREGELFLVMEYIQGESFGRLLRASVASGIRTSPAIISAVMVGVLLGLHAAHEAKTEQGEALSIVHRDVSPQNILVGVDGVARVLDFGVAKATSRLQTTGEDVLKGKLAYMSPEQISKTQVDRRTDIFAASVVLWEALTGSRLFAGDDVGGTVAHILSGPIEKPSRLVSGLDPAVDEVVLRGLARKPDDRYSTAREMAKALEAALAPASAMRVGDWVESLAGAALQLRAATVARIEDAHAKVGSNEQELMHLLSTGAPASSRSGSGSPAPAEKTTVRPHRIGEGPAPAEEISSASMSGVAEGTELEVARRRSLRGWVAACLGGVLLVLGIGGALSAQSRAQARARASLESRAAAAAAPALPPALSLAPAASAVVPVEQILELERPATAGSLQALPAGPDSSGRSVTIPSIANATPPGRTEAPTHHSHAPAATTSPSSKPAADCEVPYVIDAKGAKRFKPQCF